MEQRLNWWHRQYVDKVVGQLRAGSIDRSTAIMNLISHMLPLTVALRVTADIE